MPHAPTMRINGLPVRDGTKRVRIVIAPSDCKFGSSKEPGMCAAAKAVLRQVPNCSEVRVHIARTYLKIGDHWVRYMTSEALRDQIITFDRGGKFDAGAYYLNPLPKSMLLSRGKATGSKPKLKRGRAGKNRLKPHRIKGVREYYEYGYEKQK
jgi:hypothetical protein